MIFMISQKVKKKQRYIIRKTVEMFNRQELSVLESQLYLYLQLKQQRYGTFLLSSFVKWVEIGSHAS